LPDGFQSIRKANNKDAGRILYDTLSEAAAAHLAAGMAKHRLGILAARTGNDPEVYSPYEPE
jgi:hypothetical protein